MFLFFDVPMKEKENHKEYNKLIKGLEEEGFVMVQESVYSKMLGNIKLKQYDIDRIRRFLPSQGNVYVICLTKHEYEKIDVLLGEPPAISFDKVVIV